MGDQTEVIRQQMEGTRSALADKLEKLEAQVSDQVRQATTTVAETVENVSETVDSVKETVEDTVETVKHTFDLQWHANHHPWLLLGGAVVLGFVGGRILAGPGRPRERHRRPVALPPPPTPVPASPPKPASEKKSDQGGFISLMGQGASGHKSDEGGVLGWIGQGAADLKKIGIGMAMGVLREVVASSLPAAIGPPLSNVVDSMTEKFGGQPLGLGQGHDKPSESRPDDKPESGGTGI